MDLFEYQAKDLFAAVRRARARRAASPRRPSEARAIAAEFAAAGSPRVVVKAQVKTGGRGKAGGVKLADRPGRGRRPAAEADPRHGHQGPHRAPGAGRPRPATSRRSTTCRSCSTAPTAPSWRCARCEGGMEIEAARRHSSPDALARVAVDPLAGVDAAKAAEIVAAGRARRRTARPGAPRPGERLWAVFADEDATLVEVNPLVLTADGRVVALDGKVTLDDNAGFRHPDHDGSPTRAPPTRSRRRAKAKHLNYVKLDGEVGIIGNGAGPGHVHARRRRLRRRGVRRRPAGELPGHRRRRLGRGDGQRPGDHPVRPEVRSVFVNVFGGITSCDAVANGIVSALGMLGDRGEQVTTPLVVRLDGNNAEEGRRILDEAGHRAWSSRSTRWTVRRGGPPSSPQPAGRTGSDEMAIFLTGDSRSSSRASPAPRARKHTRADARLRHRRRRRHQPAQGRPDRRPRRRPRSRCSARSPRRWRRPAPTCRWSSCPPAGHQGRGDRGDRRADPAGHRDHRGHPGPRHRRVLGATPSRPGNATRIVGPNCPGLIASPGKSNAGIIPADITGAGPDRAGLQVGHADLPDDVRAARHRLLHRGRHRRRPGHRHHAHRLPRRRSRTTPRPTRS